MSFLLFIVFSVSQWDKKITTLPGLYVIAVLALAPFGLCTIKFMRCISLLGTFLNFCLIYKIVEATNYWNGEAKTEKRSWTLLGFAFAITLFPPMFFWFFLYYTDVVSINLVLLASLMHLRQRYKTAAVAGKLTIPYFGCPAVMSTEQLLIFFV